MFVSELFVNTCHNPFLFLYHLFLWTFNQTMAHKSEEVEQDEETVLFEGTDITTSHYVPKTARDKCQNKLCEQSFELPYNLRRPHHCRRCGEIFCRPCLQYQRRLNTMAQPDPNGVLCKVCLSCFEDRVLYLGCTKRSQTEIFKLLRKQIKDEMTDIVYEYAIVNRGVSKHPAFWKEQFKVDILQECLRLLRGFQSGIGNSETLRTVHEIKEYMNFPEWQKSTFWTLESQTTKCRQCGGKLGRKKKIRNCRVCGITLCKFCSQKDLLLYFEDGKKDKTAHLAIIRYIGCPDKEPRISLLLYCCNDCKEDIVSRQIEDQRWYLQKPKPPDLESEMVRMDEQFQSLTEDIRTDMEKLSLAIAEDVETPEEFSEDESEDGLLESEIKWVIVRLREQKVQKIQGLKNDVNEKLRTYWNMYSELKALLKSSSGKLSRRHLDLVTNYFTARKDFYIEVKAELGKMTGELEKGEPESDA